VTKPGQRVAVVVCVGCDHVVGRVVAQRQGIQLVSLYYTDEVEGIDHLAVQHESWLQGDGQFTWTCETHGDEAVDFSAIRQLLQSARPKVRIHAGIRE
jgi:hypothetical protein